MQTRIAKLEAIIPTLATPEHLAKLEVGMHQEISVVHREISSVHKEIGRMHAVSYTHLTLPTILRV